MRDTDLLAWAAELLNTVLGPPAKP
jgi:hypothetical protein